MKFDNTPLYEKIKKYLRDMILEKAEPGREIRIDSERKMADDMEVSRSSINRAITELVVEGYLLNRRGKGVFILPKEQLDQRVGTMNKIALILPDISDYYYGVLAHEIEKIAYEKGYDVMLCIIGTDYHKEKAYLNDLGNKGIKGIIAAPFVNSDVNASTYRSIYQSGTPVVLVNRIRDSMEDLPHIIYDQGEGSYAGVRHFRSTGRTNILFVGDHKSSYICQLRKNGCLKALEEWNGSGLHELYVEENHFSRRLTDLIRKENINGIICYNDIIAITTANIVLKMGLNIPKDIGIIGYDNSMLVNISPVPLSSVEFPQKIVAKAAWDMFSSILLKETGEWKQKIPTALVLRESSAGVPAERNSE